MYPESSEAESKSASRDVVLDIDRLEDNKVNDLTPTAPPPVHLPTQSTSDFVLIEVKEDAQAEWQYTENPIANDQVIPQFMQVLEDLEKDTPSSPPSLTLLAFDAGTKITIPPDTGYIINNILESLDLTFFPVPPGLVTFHSIPPRYRKNYQQDGSTDGIVRKNKFMTERCACLIFEVAWAYSPRSGAVCAFMWIGSPSTSPPVYAVWARRLLDDLQSHRRYASHPMLLGLLAHWQGFLAIRDMFGPTLLDIEAVMQATGFWYNVDWNTAKPVITEQELGDYSARVTGMAINIGTICDDLSGLRELAEFTIAECNRMELDCDKDDGSPPTKEQLLLAEASRYIRQHAISRARLTGQLLTQAKSWEHKSVLVVQGLFSLITQRDQNQNLRIANDTQILAQESKRDSTAMKAIAIVTMFFLPGTFLSSLFAIPVFDWDALHGNEVVNRRLWVYFAFTIPTTFLVVSLYLLWEKYAMHLYDNKIKARDNPAPSPAASVAEEHAQHPPPHDNRPPSLYSADNRLSARSISPSILSRNHRPSIHGSHLDHLGPGGPSRRTTWTSNR
ncbi:uncharacterized protein A1O9_10476 [Exophiala aquamarina CBS 119918]|uniref:Uncharacterized protein n=1 Tax=Exophiala aquamarina CBS 119918 TaxID=1182545 RepID=A0A072P0X1_9EURO|nr:uncharacterized protein A1O9_10476 [Exophiala aquamarina CBS 119918]KEF53501.1 hypothetical protein A1O9_10476 [Exophiala aquamarina CBS 119918]